jgi:hypothetical protein
MSDIETQIEKHIQTFVHQLTALVRAGAIEAVQRSLGGGATHHVAPRATATTHARPASSHRAKGEKRAPEQIAQTAEGVASYVQSHPGLRVEEIASGIHMDTDDLKLPIIKLLSNKPIRKTGTRRGTRYFGAGGGSVAAPSTKSHPAPAKKSAAPKATSDGKRSPAQIKATVDAVLAFVKSHPGVRSEVVREKMKLERPIVQDALNRLRADKKVTMKGEKRAAMYTAA